MSALDGFVQPTVQELHVFYKAKLKRERVAVTRSTCECLIAVPIREKYGFDRVAVSPAEYSIVIDTNTDNLAWESEGLELDPILCNLGSYFDDMADREPEHEVTAGACVRIIERFAKKEGITLE